MNYLKKKKKKNPLKLALSLLVMLSDISYFPTSVMCSFLLLILLCCLLGFQPAVLSGAECSSKEQREGGGSDGAAEADRLLVEELKVELSQTKLELETTLKAQHKHLKELDTLRLDMSPAQPDTFE